MEDFDTGGYDTPCANITELLLEITRQLGAAVDKIERLDQAVRQMTRRWDAACERYFNDGQSSTTTADSYTDTRANFSSESVQSDGAAMLLWRFCVTYERTFPTQANLAVSRLRQYLKTYHGSSLPVEPLVKDDMRRNETASNLDLLRASAYGDVCSAIVQLAPTEIEHACLSVLSDLYKAQVHGYAEAICHTASRDR